MTVGTQNVSFILSNGTFYLLKSSLIVDRSSFVIQGDTFVDTNDYFCIPKESFCIHWDDFVLIEASLVIQRARLGSYEASPVGTGGAFGRTAAAFVERASAWKLPRGERTSRKERSRTSSLSPHLLNREGRDFV